MDRSLVQTLKSAPAVWVHLVHIQEQISGCGYLQNQSSSCEWTSLSNWINDQGWPEDSLWNLTTALTTCANADTDTQFLLLCE